MCAASHNWFTDSFVETFAKRATSLQNHKRFRILLVPGYWATQVGNQRVRVGFNREFNHGTIQGRKGIYHLRGIFLYRQDTSDGFYPRFCNQNKFCYNLGHWAAADTLRSAIASESAIVVC